MASPGYSPLAEEIDRILTSPYPTQLLTLRDIATTQCSDADISHWASAKPCLIDGLASALLEGLQHWSYVLDIIAKFALNAACRDAFLQQEPTLLHSVVAQAVKAGDARERNVRVSVALLARRLPSTVALPAEVQALFVQLVEEAARRPSSATIEPVYRLLTGTGNLLLGILSPYVAVRFEEHLLDILKNGSGPNDQGLGLYCLSIMNVVCCSMDPEFRLTASSYHSEDFLASTPTSSRWKAEAMQQFFTGSKAQRSLHLLALVTIWAINKSSLEATGEKVRCLVLVNEVVTAIPVDLRKNWCTANPVMVRKLQEKLCAENQDETIKTLALRFMGKLYDLDSLPHPVLESIEMTFLEPRGVQIAHTLCPHVNDCELFANVLARAPISLLLKNAVDYATQADSTDLASGLAAVTRTLRDALTIIEEQKITGHEIRATLNEPSFAQALQCLKDLVEQPPDQHAAPQNSGWCTKALHRMRSNLAHQISDLLLRACNSSSMSPGSMTLLLNLHASSARGDLQCNHERPLWRDPIPIVDPADEDVPDEMDWREALHTHFKARAQVEQDAVSRLFAKACASLEARCENVEKPLREEREKRCAVENQNEELTQALAQLEAQNMDHILRTRDLEEERDQYVQSLEDSKDENQSLLQRISTLEQKLRDAQAQSEKQLAEIRSAKQISELDTASMIARKQEELEDLREDYDQAVRVAETKEREKVVVERELAGGRVEVERLKEEVESGNGKVKALQGTAEVMEYKIKRLEAEKASVLDELNATNDKLACKVDEISDLEDQLQNARTEHEDSKASLARETSHLSALRAEHIELERLARDQETTIKTLESQTSAYQEELKTTTHTHTTALATLNTKLHDLQSKTDRLRRKCLQKDQQIAEAEAMRANLLTAMGLSKDQGRVLVHRSRDSLAQTQECTPPTPTSEERVDGDVDGGNGSFVSNASSQESRSGPTPKRVRPRKSFAVAPATAGRMRASVGGGGAGGGGGKGSQWTAARRQTLGAVSGNRVVAGAKTPVKGKVVRMEDGEIGGEEETTFDGSELFAGTQGVRKVGEFGEE
ncbi:hypothetical protein M409DRAFT_64136 [Zasmidium cellare ATCC 36951]|uniref:Uncharacterized protein n=1 Tax=Zasmidium cellare ATCC 36951 TaxID=1080233 RepID=A0A6A6CTF0_ZASCE|nr:uncharacterized protein M409DRAFT_64136 [Zasmidium cellare ATCC 36951]KAF2170371.1 hypothetical protein M409DRAFT_64136 [Zasmidium cellare ATCC 36951]